jgi:hypothetical protein
MNLAHVLRKPALLNEGLITSRLGADIALFTSVGLHVIEHCVLAILGDTTVRAHIFALLILCVGGGRLCHFL